MSSDRWNAPDWVGVLFRTGVVFFAFFFLLGGHCHYSHHHDDDDHHFDDDDHYFDDDDFDDDDFDDDDVIILSREDDQSRYRLVDYRAVERDGRRWFLEIEGLSLADSAGFGPYDSAQFLAHADLVLDANRDLLGPRPGGGQLTLREVRISEELVLVRYELRDGRSGAVSRGPNGSADADLVFVYDVLGVLREIEDGTFGVPGG